MALINHAKREINAKIVYYGHEGAGKRASLQYIYDRIRPALRGELKTLPTGGDSLLFFDFSPFEKPVFGGYRLRFHVYSLTGTVSNPAAWKMTLKGTDGLVIVAAASTEKLPAAREGVMQLRDYLAAYGVGPSDIPCVLQINRNSSDQQPTAVRAADLDVPEMPVCLSCADSGEGVLEALSQLSREVVANIGRSEALQGAEHDGLSGMNGDSGSIDAPGVPDSCRLLKHPEPHLNSGETSVPVVPSTGIAGGPVGVTVAGSGVECKNGVVRIPLELTLGGVTQRLVVSIAIDSVQPDEPGA